MSNVMVSLLLGLGFSAWVYSKIYRSTGGNNKSAIIVAGASALTAFIFMMILLSFISPS